MTFISNIGGDGIIRRPSLTAPSTDTHKYRRGHAVIFSGPALRTGASRLTAQAALGVGAGLVSITGGREALCEHAAHVTAIMLREMDAGLSVIEDRVNAIAIGPGAGVSDALKATVCRLLTRNIPMVIDADALTSFQDDPQSLFDCLHSQTVLTPHEGEFRRLFPDIDLNDSVSAAVTAASRSGAVLLLKGPETVIADPYGMAAINRHSSPWLATAGSGDVLTGLICGLLAQGLATFEAAAIAAWLHGDIGVRAGPGLTADNMIGQIALVLRDCLIEG
jgi:ADP-dependent NAD(P)H-hydrate dehydratase / NAD(P)H-hydrate epimerase